MELWSLTILNVRIALKKLVEVKLKMCLLLLEAGVKTLTFSFVCCKCKLKAYKSVKYTKKITRSSAVDTGLVKMLLSFLSGPNVLQKSQNVRRLTSAFPPLFKHLHPPSKTISEQSLSENWWPVWGVDNQFARTGRCWLSKPEPESHFLLSRSTKLWPQSLTGPQSPRVSSGSPPWNHKDS